MITAIEIQEREPFNIAGTFWAPYESELLSLGIEFPKFKGDAVFVLKVELTEGIFKRFFFLHSQEECVIVGEGLRFPSPRSLLDYFKSPECSKERILAKREAEQRLAEAEYQD